MDVKVKRTRFFELHRSGCFLLPNPWDIGSAKHLEAMGFQALASTSSGAALAVGKTDGQLTRDEVLRHLEAICRATNLPLNADFEAGFGSTSKAVFESVQMAIATGVSGLSIEDYDRVKLFSKTDAVERMRAAREAIDRSGQKVVLVGRSEGYIRNNPDLDETIIRLVAFKEAGADCLYAPGVTDMGEMKKIVTAVAPAPVNALLLPGLTVAQLKAAGVRRISVGGAFAKAALNALHLAAASFFKRGTLQ
jgi:2-methylisocitrate lyase-like PEP mutase family enzyme